MRFSRFLALGDRQGFGRNYHSEGLDPSLWKPPPRPLKHPPRMGAADAAGRHIGWSRPLFIRGRHLHGPVKHPMLSGVKIVARAAQC